MERIFVPATALTGLSLRSAMTDAYTPIIAVGIGAAQSSSNYRVSSVILPFVLGLASRSSGPRPRPPRFQIWLPHKLGV